MSVAEVLGQELAALAFCWRLERRDGVTIGLTSHDRDLRVGGVTYRAAPGLVPSAVRQGSSFDIDSMDVRGALSSDAITARDLEAGRWDGAAVAFFLTEWTAPGALWLALSEGEIGAVEREGDAFTAELVGRAAVLGGPVAPETTPDCRAALGDRDCRVDLAKHRRVVRVSGVSGEDVAVVGGVAAEAFAFGSLRWLTGANAGISQAVVANDAAGVTLADAPTFAVEAGALALLTEGCDRRMATCFGRFGNAANFRGEPYLPGNDLLTRYPGG
ncbi:MAG: DUF2163 domain-containing protein [Sphingobium sp.]|uniref:DUF2163 domain-containing protein n=1 Tax=Sphingobium sp. TaxID=1912891 RepID=UPI0029B3BE80|nr:DUF2163 domain-containing protein [Sphingobium sp.]MDX3910333.1 DUF2163 domain-containing protein [Sphingobium sp.]